MTVGKRFAAEPPLDLILSAAGFWPGDEGKSPKITAGNNDGEDRTQVGVIEIK